MEDPELKNDPKYDVYLSERTYLNESEKEIAQQFDKAILTLAAGALALSLTFIKQISPYPKAGTLCLLFFAWIAFGASLLSTLISFLTSQAALRRQRKILEDNFFRQTEEKGEKQTEKKEEKNRLGILTNWLNWISIIFFIMGIISLTIFSSFNISTK